MTKTPRIPPWVDTWQEVWPFLRDVFLFTIGALGIAHETLVAQSAEPSLLVLFGGMVGLPVFLRKDTS